MFATGCSKEEEFKPVYNVPDEYQAFVDTFINEAANRRHTIKISNLIINYDKTIESPHCAKCNSTSMDEDVQKIISINPNIKCWFSDQELETLIFHELGHCVLGRLHEEGLLPNGDLKSLMNQYDLAVYAACIYPVGDEPCDKTFRRTYYLDELFDAETPVPEWGK